MYLYLAIFFSKILENTLSTLRLIVVANGKKKIGAILQGIVALVWILVTGIVITDLNKDILKIIFFCLGSIVGSYLGSYLEEKIALGNNLLMCTINKKYEKSIINYLSNYKIMSISEKNNKLSILLISLKRKEATLVSNIIKKIDKDSIIVSQKAKNIV